MTMELQTLIDEYRAIRTAGATGLTPAQCRTLDIIERNSPEPIEVERADGLVWVTFEDDGFTWFRVLVCADGSLDYRAKS